MLSVIENGITYWGIIVKNHSNPFVARSNLSRDYMMFSENKLLRSQRTKHLWNKEYPDDAYPRHIEESFTRSPPQGLRCPLTTCLFTRPVVVCSGHTFEKADIEHWIEIKGTCPLTRKYIRDGPIYDNVSLRSQCEEFRRKYLIKKPEKKNE